MNSEEILNTLFELQDEEYGDFQQKLTPTIPREAFIGVRVPNIRKLAKKLVKENSYKEFIATLPHKYYDENMLHSAILSEIKDYDEVLDAIDAFLPYVDNWAVCDTLKPKPFKKHPESLIEHIKRWSGSVETYTSRFGMEMLMNFYLDDYFMPEFLEIPAAVKSEEYYVNMMIAWFYATSLAKQWDATIPYIEKGIMEKWTHNKTIQKARESYRITPEQKNYLNGLKM